MFRVAGRVAAACARRSKAAAELAGKLAAPSMRHHASQAAAAAMGGSAWCIGGSMVAGLGLAAMALAPSAEAAPAGERTFIMLKPDGVHRGLLPKVIERFQDKGYTLVGIKILVPTETLASQHYAEHDGKPFFPKLVTFLSSGPVVAMCFEGKDVIKYGRTMIGATNPLASAPGTLRGDFAIDTGRNIIHGSDSVESAQHEIALWFKPGELTAYTPVSKAWVYE